MNTTSARKRSQAPKTSPRRKSAKKFERWARRKLGAYRERNAPPTSKTLALVPDPSPKAIGKWERRVMDQHGEFTSAEKVVCYRLAKLFNTAARGWAWPARGTLATLAEVSLSTVARTLRKLVSMGLLLIDSGARKWRCSRYFPSFGFRSCVSVDTHDRPNPKIGRRGESVADAPPSSRPSRPRTEQDTYPKPPDIILPQPIKRVLRPTPSAIAAPEPVIAPQRLPKPQPSPEVIEHRLGCMRRFVANLKGKAGGVDVK